MQRAPTRPGALEAGMPFLGTLGPQPRVPPEAEAVGSGGHGGNP